MTDAELVAGHLTGDRSALAAIHDRYADSLHDTAAATTRQRPDAADVLPDVFVAAAERWGSSATRRSSSPGSRRLGPVGYRPVTGRR